MTENYCRNCIVGEHHYNKTCNTCPERIARAKGIVKDVKDHLIIETE